MNCASWPPTTGVCAGRAGAVPHVADQLLGLADFGVRSVITVIRSLDGRPSAGSPGPALAPAANVPALDCTTTTPGSCESPVA